MECTIAGNDISCPESTGTSDCGAWFGEEKCNRECQHLVFLCEVRVTGKEFI
jgi:hypothetical protein